MRSATLLLYAFALALLLPLLSPAASAQSQADLTLKQAISKERAGEPLSKTEAKALAGFEARMARQAVRRPNAQPPLVQGQAIPYRTDYAQQPTFDFQGEPIVISEIRIDQSGPDNDEYFELASAADTSLDGLTYLVIGDGTGGQGVIEAVVDLSGQSISADGFFVAAEESFTLGTADLTTTLDFENGDRVTHLLVSGFTGASGDDLDTNDDGTLDSTPWTTVLDAVGFVNDDDAQFAYGAALGFTNVGPDGSFLPGFIYRDGAFGTWNIGGFNAAENGGSPGMANPSAPIELPITFEQDINYGIFDFAGASSMLAEDPTDPTNTVVETVRAALNPPASECYAGTGVGGTVGLAEPIPFSPDNTTMNVRVWSPAAGIKVVLKVEQLGNGGVAVETEAVTTVGSEWETLVFDFANPGPNPQALDFNEVYNVVVIFFDFQCETASGNPTQTYYWDDVAFGDGGPLSEQGFEDEGFPPEGWAVFDNGVGTEESWQAIEFPAGNTAAYSGYEDVADGTFAEDWLATPQFTPTESANTLVFYATQSFGSDFGSELDILVTTGTQTDPKGYNLVESFTEFDISVEGFEPIIVDLSAFNDTPIHVAFVHRNDNGDDIFIDDVRVTGSLAPIALESAALAEQNTGAVAQGDTAFVVLANLVVSGEEGLDPINVTSLTFNTEGSTAPSTDITEAALFPIDLTDNIDYDASPRFGTAIANPDGEMVFTGDFDLGYGDNFFILAYVIDDEAAPFDNVVDATFTSATVDGETVTPDPTTLDGALTIVPTTPANDNIADAISVAAGDMIVGSNVNATSEEGEADASCSSGDIGSSIFYTYTATTDGFITLDLRRSQFDTIVTVHDPADLSELACNDDVSNPLPEGDIYASLLEDVPVVSGETYLIRVSGWDEGLLMMDISFTDTGVSSVSVSELTITVQEGTIETETITLSNTGAGPLGYTATIAEASDDPLAATTAPRFDVSSAVLAQDLGMTSAAAPSPAEVLASRGGELISDGSFEAGRVLTFWTPTNPGYLGGTPILSPSSGGPDLARTGDWYAILGSGAGPLNSGITQDVMLTPGDYILTFWMLAGVNAGSPSEFFVEFDGEEQIRFAESDLVGSQYTGDYGQVKLTLSVEEAGTYTLAFLQENPTTDAPWINFFIDDVSLTLAPPVTVSPEDGSVEASGSEELTVRVDARNLEPGTYEYTLTIDSDAPSEEPIMIPVTVEVTPAVSNEDGTIPTVFAVEQNYPNPFVSATTIKYGLPSAERVKIDVYDAVGRHVATLVDQDKTAGFHEAQWNAANVASGLYVYRIQAGTHTQTMKMVIVR